jgi:hypothetical protein
MFPNAFIDKPGKPTDEELASELGQAKTLWDRLLADLAGESDIATQEWNSYSRKAGWSLRLKHGKRTILYLSPSRGCFGVSFALGDRAVEAARHSRLPQRTLKIIDESKRYPEGMAVRIGVKSPRDLAIVKKLATIKLEN